MPEFAEQVLSFACEGQTLWGIVARPVASACRATGVLIVVGGPQYRVGSHRQFVLQSRALAAGGYTTLRFDYRGMGDSGGARRDFRGAGPDLHAAVDALLAAESALQRVVVWGLCDAASAALMFAGAHPRVSGLALANPWARSEASLAAATVRHYYGARLLEREFWAKLLRGRFDWRASLRSVLANLKGAAKHRAGRAASGTDRRFQTLMARGLTGFRGRVLLILSGNDLTAQEFLQYTAAAPEWRGLLADPRLSRVDLPEADHTFSRRRWLDEAGHATLAWLDAIDEPAAPPVAAPVQTR